MKSSISLKERAINSGITLAENILAAEAGDRFVYWVGYLAHDAERDVLVAGRRAIIQELERRGTVTLVQKRAEAHGVLSEGFEYIAIRTGKRADFDAKEAFRAATAEGVAGA